MRKNIQPDNPLSIVDGAPRTVEVCGMPCRLPAAMDYRISARIDDACEIGEEDYAVCLLYCCLHANKKQIAKLWQQAREPVKLYDAITVWLAGVPIDALGNAIDELMSMADGGDDSDSDDTEETPGKKKIGAQ